METPIITNKFRTPSHRSKPLTSSKPREDVIFELSTEKIAETEDIFAASTQVVTPAAIQNQEIESQLEVMFETQTPKLNLDDKCRPSNPMGDLCNQVSPNTEDNTQNILEKMKEMDSNKSLVDILSSPHIKNLKSTTKNIEDDIIEDTQDLEQLLSGKVDSVKKVDEVSKASCSKRLIYETESRIDSRNDIVTTLSKSKRSKLKTLKNDNSDTDDDLDSLPLQKTTPVADAENKTSKKLSLKLNNHENVVDEMENINTKTDDILEENGNLKAKNNSSKTRLRTRRSSKACEDKAKYINDIIIIDENSNSSDVFTPQLKDDDKFFVDMPSSSKTKANTRKRRRGSSVDEPIANKKSSKKSFSESTPKAVNSKLARNDSKENKRKVFSEPIADIEASEIMKTEENKLVNNTNNKEKESVGTNDEVIENHKSEDNTQKSDNSQDIPEKKTRGKSKKASTSNSQKETVLKNDTETVNALDETEGSTSKNTISPEEDRSSLNVKSSSQNNKSEKQARGRSTRQNNKFVNTNNESENNEGDSTELVENSIPDKISASSEPKAEENTKKTRGRPTRLLQTDAQLLKMGEVDDTETKPSRSTKRRNRQTKITNSCANNVTEDSVETANSRDNVSKTTDNIEDSMETAANIKDKVTKTSDNNDENVKEDSVETVTEENSTKVTRKSKKGESDTKGAIVVEEKRGTKRKSEEREIVKEGEDDKENGALPSKRKRKPVNYRVEELIDQTVVKEVEPETRSKRIRKPTNKMKDIIEEKLKKNLNASASQSDVDEFESMDISSPVRQKKKPAGKVEEPKAIKKQKLKTLESSGSSTSFLSDVGTPSRKWNVTHKVVFTLLSNPDITSIVKNLGGSIIETVDSCTILVTEGLKRTQKLLLAIAMGKPICSPAYLIESKKAKMFLGK